MCQTLIATVWDDGLVTDLQLLDVLKQHNVRASFAISPGEHRAVPTLNDKRSERYGYRMAKSDLHRLGEHDICNHTLNHREMTCRSRSVLAAQIQLARRALQQEFDQDILGFVYPYGVRTEVAEQEVAIAGHLYSRITSTAESFPEVFQTRHVTGYPRLTLRPQTKWFQNIAPALHNDQFVLLYGHSYEIDNWDQVDQLYAYLKTVPDSRICTMTEMAAAILVGDQFS